MNGQKCVTPEYSVARDRGGGWKIDPFLGGGWGSAREKEESLCWGRRGVCACECVCKRVRERERERESCENMFSAINSKHQTAPLSHSHFPPFLPPSTYWSSPPWRWGQECARTKDDRDRSSANEKAPLRRPIDRKRLLFPANGVLDQKIKKWIRFLNRNMKCSSLFYVTCRYSIGIPVRLMSTNRGENVTTTVRQQTPCPRDARATISKSRHSLILEESGIWTKEKLKFNLKWPKKKRNIIIPRSTPWHPRRRIAISRRTNLIGRFWDGDVAFSFLP